MQFPHRILFLTPPFTQLNTPYPATAYLKGFMNTLGAASHQADLSLEVILALFSPAGLREVFDVLVGDDSIELSENAFRVYQLRDEYLRTIGPVMAFLQNRNQTLAYAICDRSYLPEAGRFREVDDLDWAFGSMGTHDKARHLATLYLEDLGDLIAEAIDPYFGFSRYAERLGRSASSFDELYKALQQPLTYVDRIMLAILAQHIEKLQPKLVAMSVPFPGNLYASLRCGQSLK